MENYSDLEVDVNGQYIFFLDKKIISTYSGRLRKLFGKHLGTKKRMKVIFDDFPGSAECFELIVRFCYNNGRLNITPSNIFLLNSAANFMEMNEDINGIPNLLHQTETYLKRGIHHWTWSELVLALKHCQSLFLSLNSSHLLQEFLNVLVQRFTLPFLSSPCSSSSDNSSFQFSGDFSIESTKNYNTQIPFWFEDLIFLNIDLFEKVVNTMVSQKNDHVTVCSFIFYYQKSRFAGASSADKCKITETIISLLWLLDKNSIPRKGLFYNFRVAIALKIGKSCKVKLENLIGSRLDEAALDDLLVRAPSGKKYAYDVNLILRLLKVFIDDIYKSNCICIYRLKKVCGLVDSYMAEVGPDPRLKLSKFLALALALPDTARDCHDKMYQAIHMYLQVRRDIDGEEKKRLYGVVNLNKLSTATLQKDLIENSKVRKRLPVGCAKNIDLSSENEKVIRTNMRLRAVEPEKVMRMRIGKVSKLRLSNPNRVRALPRLCRTL